MSTCPNCSAEVKVSARFCSECGERLPQPPDAGDILAIRSTIIKAGSVTMGPEVDGGECPICGRHNPRTATFRCKGCNQALICVSHQDVQSLLCSECIRQQRRKSKTVTVAPDGSGDFTTLEEAVMGCVVGATINLMPGRHHLVQGLVVSASLTIKGAGHDKTLVVSDGDTPTLQLVGGNLIVEGVGFHYEGDTWVNGVEVRDGRAFFTSCSFARGWRRRDEDVHLNSTFATADSDDELVAAIMVGSNGRASIWQCFVSDSPIGVRIQDAAECTLSRNNFKECGYGIAFYGNASGDVHNNRCDENSVGIKVIGGSPRLSANVIEKNTAAILWMSDAPGSITGNQLIDNKTGIMARGATLERNVCRGSYWSIRVERTSGDVRFNTVTDCGNGIEIMDSPHCLVEGNTCSNNKYDGLRVSPADGTRIKDNMCMDNGGDGIDCSQLANNACIEGNTCSGNSGDGITIFATEDASYRLQGNTCLRNSKDGINIWGGSAEIRSNTCQENTECGIRISSGRALIQENVVSQNKEDGIRSSTYPQVQRIIGNTCVGNGGYGVRAHEADIVALNVCSENGKGSFRPTTIQE